MDESTLIQKMHEGDRQAFRLLVERYQDIVYNTVYSFVQNSDDAQDLCQDVFVEVFRSFGNFRVDCSISTWIYRISVNKSLNYIKKRKNEGVIRRFQKTLVGAKADQVFEAVDPEKHPSGKLENKELGDQLNKALASLPENQRIAFILHKYEDLPYKEIARVMETSVSSIESLIHRARKNLQKKLLEFWKT